MSNAKPIVVAYFQNPLLEEDIGYLMTEQEIQDMNNNRKIVASILDKKLPDYHVLTHFKAPSKMNGKEMELEVFNCSEMDETKFEELKRVLDERITIHPQH